MCLQKLPTATRDGLLRPEELVGGLAIREATAEVVSRGYRRVPQETAPFAMAAHSERSPSTTLLALCHESR